jgi:hypothetical protein
MVPDGSTSISAELGNSETPGWVLRGPILRSDERRYSSPAMVVGVRLRPGVAFILSAMAADAMVDRRIRLSAIPSFCDLVSAYPAPETPDQRIDVLERFLIRSLENAAVPEVVARAGRSGPIGCRSGNRDRVCRSSAPDDGRRSIRRRDTSTSRVAVRVRFFQDPMRRPSLESVSAGPSSAQLTELRL